MLNENMMIKTDDGVIDIALRAASEDSLKTLREELFNWYEDLVGRELEKGRHVETTSTPYASIKTRNEAFDRVEECVEKLKNLTTAYIVLKSHEALCGEVVQIPIRHEGYEEILAEAAKLLRWLQETYLIPF